MIVIFVDYYEKKEASLCLDCLKLLELFRTDVHKKISDFAQVKLSVPCPTIGQMFRNIKSHHSYKSYTRLSYHFDDCRALATAVRSVAPKLMPA